MNCNKCGRSFKNIGSYSLHISRCNLTKQDLQEIDRRYCSGSSLTDLCKDYPHHIVLFVTKNKRRSKSESIKLVHKLKPDSFKLSDKTKDKIRKKRLEFFKNNPEAVTSWRQKEISYPEKLFQQLVEKNELAKKYDIIREYSFFPYFIDFAFTNIKLAVEIDGSQHWLKESKIKRDKEKDQALINSGWKVYRIPAFKIQKEFEDLEKQFLEYLSTIEQQPKQFIFENDIIEYEKIKQQKKQQKRIKTQQYFSKLDDEFKKRKQDFDLDDKSSGITSRLSKLWNVSHTQVRRYLQKINNGSFV
jgi:very-short-patch-repair endonuclease